MTLRLCGAVLAVTGAIACTCTVPATLGDKPWPCTDGGPCPTGTACVDGFCEGAGSSGGGATGSSGGSSAGTSGGAGSIGSTSGGSSSGSTTGGLAAGERCDGGSDCQSGICLGRCCESLCDISDALCGQMVYCDRTGGCNYPADGRPCKKSCNPNANPESLVTWFCDAGSCSDPVDAGCPSGTPICNQAGTACVACYDPSATPCGGTTCCDPSTGNCVQAGACPSCIPLAQPCTPASNTGTPACCGGGKCCPVLRGDGGYCQTPGVGCPLL
ncbi:MAG: hypothetical protein ACYDCL_01345 [Myxococcales bacterium]